MYGTGGKTITQKERLVELLQDSVGANHITFMGEPPADYWAYIIADYLLTNGVIVPPCKVGDTVWWLPGTLDAVFEDVVDSLIYESDVETCWVITKGTGQFTERDIGKSYFYTKEEAEQALKGLNL